MTAASALWESALSVLRAEILSSPLPTHLNITEAELSYWGLAS